MLNFNFNFIFAQNVFNHILTSIALRDRSLFMGGGGGGMGEKMGGPEILATAKRGVLGNFFVIEGGS